MKLTDHLCVIDLVNRSPAVCQLTSHASDLQKTAASLSSNVRRLLGVVVQDGLLRCQANAAPHFLRAALLATPATLVAGEERQQCIQDANAQAMTLVGALAVAAGEDTLGAFHGDCLTFGKMVCKTFDAKSVCFDVHPLIDTMCKRHAITCRSLSHGRKQTLLNGCDLVQTSMTSPLKMWCMTCMSEA